MELNESPISAVIEIIRTYMRLSMSQVVLYNQNWKIPPDNRLYIAVGLQFETPYGSSLEYQCNEDQTALLEVVTLHTRETYSINAYSFGPDALHRKDEIIMAMHSTLAQQMAEKFSFKFASLPTAFTDTSEVEGASRLNRYSITMAALCVRRKSTVVQHFDKFGQSLIINP